jgi:hypothetical protein
MSRPTPLNPMVPPPADGQVVWLTVRLSPSPVNLYRIQSIYQDGYYYAAQFPDAGPIQGQYVGWLPSN